jgi:putative FmdB family regulatory protein
MTYEYVCTACGHEWEAEQPISADPLKKCPSCKRNKAKRQVSGGAGFILKGGGWYADGYGSNKSAGSSESKPKASTPKAGEPKASEPKASEPAKKTETKNKSGAAAA